MTTEQLLEKLEKLRQTESVSLFVDDLSGHSFERVGTSQWFKVQTRMAGDWFTFVEAGERFKYSRVYELV